MKTIHNSDFFKIEIDEEKQIFISSWLDNNSEMTNSQIRNEIEKASSLIKKYKPKFILSDDRNRTFIYTVEIQNWVSLTLTKAGNEAGISKYVVLLPSEIIASMSTEQLIDEGKTRNYTLKIFSDENEAMKWFEL